MVQKKTRRALQATVLATSTSLGGAWMVLDRQNALDDAVIGALQTSAETMKANPIYSEAELDAMDAFQAKLQKLAMEADSVQAMRQIVKELPTAPGTPALNKIIAEKSALITKESQGMAAEQLQVYKIGRIDSAIQNFKEREKFPHPIRPVIANVGEYAQAVGVEMSKPTETGTTVKSRFMIVNISPLMLKQLTSSEQDFVVRHELFHVKDSLAADGTLKAPPKTPANEKKADAYAVSTTCDLTAATSAMAKFGALEAGMDINAFTQNIKARRNRPIESIVFALTQKPSVDGVHPHWTERLDNVKKTFDASCKSK